jgi:outer membrane protein OmpA-like peptidoglycan-associated protein
MVPATTVSINYQHHSGPTEIGFQGSALEPQATGRAKVNGKEGRIQINAEFSKLEPATKFGAEYLTYVLWAITPEGKSSNLGEILLNGDNTKITVTTSLQTFGLIVTAEPYFAVTEPSEVVVLQNVVTTETTGTFEQTPVSYQLLGRGAYSYEASSATGATISAPNNTVADSKAPIEYFEAENAVQIAMMAGAQDYAPDALAKAQDSLTNARDLEVRHQDEKVIVQDSRDAVQNAADAHHITIEAILAEQAAEEQAAAAQRVAASQQQADAAAEAQRQADVQKAQAQRDAAAAASANAQAQAASAQAQAETTAALAQTEQERLAKQQAQDAAAAAAAANAQAQAASAQAQADTTAALAQTEQERLAKQQAQDAAAAAAAANAQAQATSAQAQADTAAAQAQTEHERLAKQQAQDAAAAAQAQAAQAAAAAQAAQAAAAQSEKEKQQLRATLLEQFNKILPTTDTPQGLKVNMADVLFTFGKYDLRPEAREALAKLSGIVLGHPGLQLTIDGYTDSVGTDAFNQTLSENRAGAVHDYVVKQGLDPAAATSKGFGKSDPVATNDTAVGRQLNRRVEIIVSGEVIGTQIGELLPGDLPTTR